MRSELQEWSNFLAAESHVLKAHPHLIAQQAANQTESSIIAEQSLAYLDKSAGERAWLRLLNKPHISTRPILTLTSHNEHAQVLSCGFSPDGRRIVSAARLNIEAVAPIHYRQLAPDYWPPRVWDASTGQQLFVLSGHSAAVNACAYSPDGRHILTGSADESMTIWDANSGAVRSTIAGGNGPILDCAYSPDGKFMVSTNCPLDIDGRYIHDEALLQIWDAATERLVRAIRPGRALLHCTFSADANQVVGASANVSFRDRSEGKEQVTVWDADSGRVIVKFHKGDSWINDLRCAATLPEVALLVSGGSLLICDIKSGALRKTLRAEAGLSACTYSPDGKFIAAGTNRGDIIIYDTQTGAELSKLAGHSGAVNDCHYSRDGSKIVSASDDGTIRIWRAPASGSRTVPTTRHQSPWIGFDLSPNGTRLLATSKREVTLCDLPSADPISVLANDGKPPGFIPEGATVVTVGSYTYGVYISFLTDLLANFVQRDVRLALKFWDAATGRSISRLRTLLAPNSDNAYAVSPDGGELMIARWGITRFDLRTGKAHAPQNKPEIALCCYAPNGRRFATIVREGTWRIEISDLATSETVAIVSNYPTTMSFSPDSSRLATSARDNTVRIWDACTGGPVQTLMGHNGAVHVCRFLPDGVRIISTSSDRTLRVWNAATGVEEARFACLNAITAAAVGPDNLIACGDDAGNLFLLRLVSVEAGIPIVTAVRHWRITRTLGARLLGLIRRRTHGRWSDELSIQCGWCGQQSTASAEIIAAIVKQTFTDASLLTNCVHCHGQLRYNPFVVDRGTESAGLVVPE